MRQDQMRLTVSVAGTDLGVFDAWSGGDLDSDSVKYAPGAMGPEYSLGGRQTVDNFTVSRNYKQGRDNVIKGFLNAQRGRGRVVAVRQPLDPEKNPFGSPETYTGTLKRVGAPEHDSRSNDPAILELEVDADGVAAA